MPEPAYTQFQVFARIIRQCPGRGVGGINDDRTTPDELLLPRNHDRPADEKVEKVKALEAELAELGQAAGINQVRFLRSHVEEVLKRQVSPGTLNDGNVGKVEDNLEQKVAEHADWVNGRAAVVLAVVLNQFRIDEAEVYLIMDAPEFIVLLDKEVIQLTVWTEFQSLLWLYHVCFF